MDACMGSPDVAVVIVTYKSAALTVACLKSIEQERSVSASRIRAVVVDNASEDAPAIAQAIDANNWHAWATLVVAPRNGGFAYGNNLGVNCAFRQGVPDFVYLLNPDTEVRPGVIDTLVHFLENSTGAGIAGSSIENRDGSDWPFAFRFPTLQSEVIAGMQWGVVTSILKAWNVPMRMGRTSQQVDWISGAGMMVRCRTFVALGGFDESYFLYFEEVDFCRRAREAGSSVWHVPEGRIMHICGQSTGVTDHDLGYRRLPGYWFESRRRYFAVSFGIGRSIAIDLAAVAAGVFGLVKRFFLGRRHTATPHFIRDLLSHSMIWRRNREMLPFRGLSCARPVAPELPVGVYCVGYELCGDD
jgi:N-acetylglucosaminyl-diphospho-decaprenol L-rhamnosyltransferase